MTSCESLYARSNSVLSFTRSSPIKNKTKNTDKAARKANPTGYRADTDFRMKPMRNVNNPGELLEILQKSGRLLNYPKIVPTTPPDYCLTK